MLKVKRLQWCDFSTDSQISAVLVSNLAISVNHVNSWRKFKGGVRSCKSWKWYRMIGLQSLDTNRSNLPLGHCPWTPAGTLAVHCTPGLRISSSGPPLPITPLRLVSQIIQKSLGAKKPKDLSRIAKIV